MVAQVKHGDFIHLWYASLDYHLLLDWKTNWKIPIFWPAQRSLLPQRPGWTDELLNFFWVPCKS
jgi:membrane-bound metal-dependent hydrolase YbcI (DUF457 family)